MLNTILTLRQIQLSEREPLVYYESGTYCTRRNPGSVHATRYVSVQPRAYLLD